MNSRSIPVVELSSLGARLRGLIGRPPPASGKGVWLQPCRQVHTLGMRYAIDTVHLDDEGHVLMVQTLRPWRLGRFVIRAAGVLEMRAGEAERLSIEPGARVTMVRGELD